jgi:uncharacterized membrane protein YfcA
LAAKFDKMRFLGTTAWFFCIVNLIKLPFSVGVGATTSATLGLWAVLIPVVLVGALIGKLLIDRVKQSTFEKIVLVLVGVAALNLLFR